MTANTVLTKGMRAVPAGCFVMGSPWSDVHEGESACAGLVCVWLLLNSLKFTRSDRH